MSDFSPAERDLAQVGANGPGANEVGANLPVFSVSEISQAIKRALEGKFEFVRVRGEISGFKRAASGHLYLTLKDENAVLDAVCWRGSVGRLAISPEDGMEVIASGRVTAYPGRSRYQIVVEQMELAGEGALLKLLEERKSKLLAEGLFDQERKRAPPFLPEVIGVVTSPTGAVIRDILHRLADRFPRRVIIWPVLVQGKDAAEQIAVAIRGFNRLASGGTVPRPDLLIVARGGGSLEDLWPFNEEIVVRAAADSEIPLISGVGHQTDTTLIDFAADRRAPTPTAAAEMAVPVRRDLIDRVLEADRRMHAAGRRLIEDRRTQVQGLGRGLPDPARLLGEMSQRLDERTERFINAVAAWIGGRRERVADLGARLPDPRRQLALARERFEAPSARLAALIPRLLDEPRRDLDRLDAEARLRKALKRTLAKAGDLVAALGRVLESTSYENVLRRGFAVVRGPEGVITGVAQVTPGLALDIELANKEHAAAIGAGDRPAVTRKPKPKPKGQRAWRAPGDDPQGSLL